MKTLTLSLASLFFATLASAAVTQNFDQNLPLSNNGSLELHNVNGAIKIIAWDKPEVSIAAVKSARTQEDLDLIKIKVSSSGDKVRIVTEHERKKFSNTSSGEVQYTVMVPAGTTLKHVNSVNSDLNISGIKGSISADIVNGNIKASDISENARLHAVNGSVKVEATQLSANSKLLLQTVNGSCNLSLPADSNAKINAATVNGRVNCDLPVAVQKQRKNVLEGTLGTGTASVTLKSVNGTLGINKS